MIAVDRYMLSIDIKFNMMLSNPLLYMHLGASQPVDCRLAKFRIFEAVN